jgi:hypothetical protein
VKFLTIVQRHGVSHGQWQKFRVVFCRQKGFSQTHLEGILTPKCALMTKKRSYPSEDSVKAALLSHFSSIWIDLLFKKVSIIVKSFDPIK